MRDFPPEVTASDIPTTRVPSAFLRWMVRDQFAVVFSMTLLVVAWQLPSVGWPANGSSVLGVKMRTR